MRYALVTAGSRGVGKACCLTLAEMGYNVLINYVSNEDAAQSVLETVQTLGVKGELLKFDVADAKQVEMVLGEWIEKNSEAHIEVLVNNAGIRRDNLMFWMSNDEWHSVVDTSLDGAFYTTNMVIKQMMAKKRGRVINMVSLSGIKGMPGQVNYSAAKAGVIGLTKALAQECATKKVTVNAIGPGFLESDMT